MSLSKHDLQDIEQVVEGVVLGIVKDAVKPLATKADLDRMEARLVTSMNLLERDSFSRLDDHEARIAKLECTEAHG